MDDRRPEIQPGLGARATADAYYDAIRNENGARFCGLLSKRHAAEVVGDESERDPVAACAAEIEDYDWSQVSEEARGVHPRAVKGSGKRRTVTLSNGKRALLRKEAGRWVVDDIKR